MRPTLLTLEGENIINLSGEEINYLREYYPELLGFWATLVKGLKAIGKGITGGIRRKRSRRKAAMRQKALAEYQDKVRRVNQFAKLQTVLYNRRKAAEQKKKNLQLITLAALPVAALFLLG